MESLIAGAGTQLCMMLVVVAVGFVIGKLRYFTPEVCNGINNYLMNVALPCLIIGSVAVLDADSAQALILPAFALAAAQFVAFIAVSAACNVLFRTPRDQRNLYLFMNMCTNTGFFALPILQAVYGDETVLVSSIFILVCNLFIGSVGFMILAAADKESGPGKPKINLKTLINAPLVSCLFALGVFFAGWSFPPVLQSSLDFLGSTCAPLAMLLVGAVLSRHNLGKVFGETRMYGFILVRQLIVPLASIFLLRLAGVDPLIVTIFVIMFAAPVGSMVPAFAGIYHQDTRLAATGTVLSTMSCFVAYPVLIAVMALA